MMRVATCLFFLCLLQAGAVEDAQSPIQKVVAMLEDMKEQVAKEGDADKESYDKYKCWCSTNEFEKKTAISNSEAQIEQLQSFIEEAAGTEADLKTQIEGLHSDIADDKDALETAQEMKEKETAEFEQDETYMKETLAALEEALKKLSLMQEAQKHQQPVMMADALVQVKAVVEKHTPHFRGAMQKDLMDLLGSLKEVNPTIAGAFLETKAPTGAAAGAKSYNSQSGQIVGILGAMEDKFKADLTDAQKEEIQAIIQFQKLTAAKTAEMVAANKQIENKEKELADLLQQAAQAKEDLEATKETLAADQDFLANLIKECTVVDQEFAERVKARNTELLGLSDTLKILTSDEARDLFGKTISFLQVSSKAMAMMKVQKRAMNRIMRDAAKYKNWALAGLAMRVQLDDFKEVKKAMDEMMAELKSQQQEEYDKNEWCKDEIDKTEDNIKEAGWSKEDLDEAKKELENKIATLTEEIKTLKGEVADMEVALKQAGEQRKSENLLFQQSVSDARATGKVLGMALDKLKETYTFAQTQQGQPAKPGGYEKSGASGGVMQMLAKIISDAEIMEQDLVMTEKNSQEDYVTFVGEATASIEADRGAIAEKEEQLAQTEALLSENSEALMANGAESMKLGELLAARHVSCDYLMKNFEVRQKARKSEMEGIEEAKAILSGANFGL